MNNKEKTILVTGGAGFIGSHLVDALIDRGYSSILVMDDLSLGKLSNLDIAKKSSANVDFYHFDLAQDNLNFLCERHFDLAFHLAVIPLPASLVYPKEVIDKNVAMTTSICELARKGNIRRLVHFSSSEVYGTAKTIPMDEEHPKDPATPYAASKLACDAIVLSYKETFGINVIIVRPFNNFGPRQNDKAYAGVIPLVINKVMRKKPIVIFGDGLQTRDFIFVEDTANAAIDIALKKERIGEIINIGSGKETSVNELIKTIIHIMGAENLPIEYQPPRPGDVRRHLSDIKKAKSLINFEPKIDLNEGLSKTIQWYKDKTES